MTSTKIINETILKYNINIYEICKNLINSNKAIENWTNNDIDKIFEYFTCIKLMGEHKQKFLEYSDIDPTFKEENRMSQNDTGVDASNCVDTIVQCKLRKDYLNWKECSTFFGSQNAFDAEKKKTVVKWENLILARNSECKLSSNLKEKNDMFVDKTYDRPDVIKYCQDLLDKPPIYPKEKKINFKKRDYQDKCIELIKNKENIVICLPTGSGKSVVIIYSIKKGSKYLILVPLIHLTSQFQDELIKHKPDLKNDIQIIGDGNNIFDNTKNITICVYNSVYLISDHFDTFEKIFVDEAHHIATPMIYTIDNDNDNPDCDNDDNEENDDNEDSDEDSEENDNEDSDENGDEDSDEDSVEDDVNVNNYDNDECIDNDDEKKINKKSKKKSVKKPKKESVKKPEKKPVKETEKKSVKKPEKKSVMKPDKKSVKKPVKETENKSGKEPEKENVSDNIDEIDDNEIDDAKTKRQYIKLIKNLAKYNNNVYLSATIDEQTDFKFYKKDLREMIDNKHLCDYVIKIPIFSNDPSNKNICEYLIKNYRNVIIYCNSRTEGNQINKLMNELMPNCSEYVDCETPRKKRNAIIDKYKNGTIAFLVNVRVLVEGFDAPITKGVVFMHLPTTKTTLIQIIGRALRLHPLKTFANIILPYSLENDQEPINNFLKIMARNDSRIKKSYQNRLLRGYISLDKIDNFEDNEIINNNERAEFRYNMIYDNMGILKNRQEIWNYKKDLLFEYTNLNKNAPHQTTVYKNCRIGSFLDAQKRKIFDIDDDLYTELSKNIYIKKSIDEYLDWKKNHGDILSLDKKIMIILKYCNKNKCVPSQKTKCENMSIGYWYFRIRIKIRDNKDDNLYEKISTNQYLKIDLDNYIKKKKAKKLSEEEWINLFFRYCKEYNKLPTAILIYEEYNIGYWYTYAKSKMTKESKDIYNKLAKIQYVKEDLDKYLKKKEKSKSIKRLSEQEWINLLFQYYEEYNEIPGHTTIYKKYNLYQWYAKQKEKIIKGSKSIYEKLSKNQYIKEDLDKYLVRKKTNNSDDCNAKIIQNNNILTNNNKNTSESPIKKNYKDQKKNVKTNIITKNNTKILKNTDVIVSTKQIFKKEKSKK